MRTRPSRVLPQNGATTAGAGSECSGYPALSQLDDEELIRSEESAGRRSFELTDAGRDYVNEHREALGSPWDEAGEGVPSHFVDLRKSLYRLLADAE